MHHLVRPLVVLLAMVLLAACGGAPALSNTPTSVPTEATTPEAAAEITPEPVAEATPEATSAEAFPVTVEHKYGSTTITTAPQRVVSLGYNDQDPILALGTVPVAVRYWFGDESNAVWPWARDRLNGATPQVLNMPFGELNFEAIAALQPDLIIGVSSGVTAEEYATLSEIAPTVAQSDEYVDFGVPWQEQTEVIGRALGQEALAQELVAATETRLAEVRAAHPAFEGATAAIAAPAEGGQYYFSGPQHERQRFLTSLGFELPTELAEIAGDAFYGTLSGERLDLLDTDVLVWTVTPEQREPIEANPIYQQLAVAQEGRAIFLDTSGSGDLAGPALVFSSVLSLPTVFDELVPQLAAAVDGNPATSTGPATTADPTVGDGERVIQHVMGETSVPANPQRVVVLDTGELDSALTLGVTPVGAVEALPGLGFPAYLTGTDGIETVGTIQEPNLETIAALRPDLILSSKLRHEQIYEQLSAIAPTVFAETTGVTWKENFDLHAEALGRTEQAAEVKRAYAEHIDAFRAAMGDSLADTEVSIVRFLPGDTRVYQKASFSGTVLEDAGIRRPPSQDVDEFALTNLSPELIPEIGGDVIFVMSYGPEDETTRATITSNPLWQTLSAVQEGRVYEVSDGLWMLGIGYTAANGVIDDLERFLVATN
jgi:iron complex transport system substrate-binding protein